MISQHGVKKTLALNLEKTQYIQFLTNNQKKLELHVKVADILIPNTLNTKFLGVTLDKKLRWKAYSKELTFKLNKACYAIRTIKTLVSTKALISIYFAYFHSLLMYAIIF